MLRPELRHISPNDYSDWQAFSEADHREPWDEFGSFVLDIGLEGEKGTTLFQVVVATPAAVQRAKQYNHRSRVLVVESFQPDQLEFALRQHVSAQAALTWEQIVERLRRHMYWEHEREWSG
jgi:hypothetical protein